VSEKDLRKKIFVVNFCACFCGKRSSSKKPLLKNVMPPIVGVFKSFDDYGECVGL